MKRTLTLLDPAIRQRALQAVLAAPDGWEIVIKEPTRNSSQNALIHAVLTVLGDSVNWQWNGVAVDIDDLKSIFVAAYRKATGGQMRFAIGIDGQPVILNWRTREFTKREASEFVEMVQSWMAENLEAT